MLDVKKSPVAMLNTGMCAKVSLVLLSENLTKILTVKWIKSGVCNL